MHSITGTDLTLTRGDTWPLLFKLDGRALTNGTTLTMTIKEKVKDEDAVFSRSAVVVDNQAVIPIYPADTKSLSVRTYYWDARLLDEDMTVETPMEYGTFTLLQDIGSDVG